MRLKVTNKSLIGERLKNERLRLGLTQDQAAQKCDVRRETWGRYERGQLEMGSTVFRAFVALGADMQYIISGIRAQDSEVNTLKSSFEFIETLPLEQREESRQLLESGIREQSSKLAMRSKKRQDLMLILDGLVDDDFDLVMSVAVKVHKASFK